MESAAATKKSDFSPNGARLKAGRKNIFNKGDCFRDISNNYDDDYGLSLLTQEDIDRDDKYILEHWDEVVGDKNDLVIDPKTGTPHTLNTDKEIYEYFMSL